jgi:hypothetical protein
VGLAATKCALRHRKNCTTNAVVPFFVGPFEHHRGHLSDFKSCQVFRCVENTNKSVLAQFQARLSFSKPNPRCMQIFKDCDAADTERCWLDKANTGTAEGSLVTGGEEINQR